jgi:hypothetical protein
VVLAKYQHKSIFKFNLLIKQHILIFCKNLRWLCCLISLSNPCYQVGFCTDLISTIQKCVTVVQLIVAALVPFKEVLQREIQGLKVYPVYRSYVFSMTGTYF